MTINAYPASDRRVTKHDREPNKPRRAHLGPFSVRVPQSRTMRVLLGIALLLGGMVGFLPILGFWMIPLGLIVLSIDFHPIRRMRRRFQLWWARRQKKKS